MPLAGDGADEGLGVGADNAGRGGVEILRRKIAGGDAVARLRAPAAEAGPVGRAVAEERARVAEAQGDKRLAAKLR